MTAEEAVAAQRFDRAATRGLMLSGPDARAIIHGMP